MTETTIVPRLKARYDAEVRDQLKEQLGLANVMQVPKLEKIVINVGCGAAVDQKQLIDKVVEELSIIAGQKPVVTRARKAIATFKLRENMPIGVMVTLFPEIDYDRVDASRGMDITIVTTGRTNAEGKALLDAFKFPFRREGQ